jgi:hypothetical protein
MSAPGGIVGPQAGTGVKVSVCVKTGVNVFVTDGVNVGEGVADGVSVNTGVGDGVKVGVLDGVGVGVGVLDGVNVGEEGRCVDGGIVTWIETLTKTVRALADVMGPLALVSVRSRKGTILGTMGR